ncbi:phosphate transport regulon regulator PhoU [Parvularcula bermudensis HTCC2503]|uniref:Phosphate-specific transport system accessory protein PhoU n=1 Tax=Parvularcula bermudensis (strain ATCC BAA-594 / HTCC2503 / KCTC 12087) TaxID=314260 RepID=E0THQ4_PARBH|nr:phosphate signaling complex protein PhoU [Parvularcula bermudensis]ADM09350.1 phosphate transport regulon regulator PhoU [Parvularcula bermudensis HTCC2503]
MPFRLLKTMTGRLDKIEITLATMGGAVEEQVAQSIIAFERRDLLLAEEIRHRDVEIDDYEQSIERQVVALLEARRPSGSPLRRAMTAIKIAAEMERIGDLAKNVAKRTTVVGDLDPSEAASDVMPVVARMGRRALTQFGESLDSLFRGNAEAAIAVRQADDQIDDLYNSIFRDILVSMSQSAAGVVLGTHLVFIAKNFERIGDHATNIAERVHYTLTGEELTDERPKKDNTSLTGYPLKRDTPGRTG